MRIGLLAYSTDTGLGNQTYEFYKHMNPTKVLLVDLSRFNHMPTHHERYPGALICNGIPDGSHTDWLTNDVDIVFVCETPLNYNLYTQARKKGVKVVQQYNYEFLDYFREPDFDRPSVLAAPSAWNTEIVKSLLPDTPVMDWPVPVNNEYIQGCVRERLKTFTHIIGRPTASDRNGTLQFLDAVEQLGTAFDYEVFLQPPDDNRAKFYFLPVKERLQELASKIPTLKIIENVTNYNELYSGDVLVMPRKYGGLCLPMQEALASGMPVIMTDISPNFVLPKEWLVKSDYENELVAHTKITYYKADTNSLIESMLQFVDSEYLRRSSIEALKIADGLSWQTLKPIYNQLFENVLKSKYENLYSFTHHPGLANPDDGGAGKQAAN